MKFKHLTMVFIIGLVVLLISSCGSNNNNEQIKENENVKNAEVRFEFSETDDATAVNSMYTGSSNLVNVVVKTNQKITDIKFMNAEIANSDKKVAEFYVNSIGYEQEELTPEAPIVYATEFPGSVPSNLISYKDTTGDKKVLSLSMSGKDGSVVSADALIIEKPEVAVESANVDISYVSDEQLNSLSDYNTIIDPAFTGEEDRAYLRNIMFSTDASITGFKILDCDVGKCTDASTEMIVNDVVYEYGEVEGNVPLIIQTTFPGSASVRGISYTDTTGEEKAFILSESGDDGTLVVRPAYIQH